jgi:hypothetical protein
VFPGGHPTARRRCYGVGRDAFTGLRAESRPRLTLCDPSLQLALCVPERESYVDDGEGRPLTCRIGFRAGGEADAPVAALTHDPALLEQRAFTPSYGSSSTNFVIAPTVDRSQTFHARRREGREGSCNTCRCGQKG